MITITKDLESILETIRLRADVPIIWDIKVERWVIGRDSTDWVKVQSLAYSISMLQSELLKQPCAPTPTS